MISIDQFYKLRLNKLLTEKSLSRVWFTEYLGKLWFGQSYYFTDCMQPMSNLLQTHTVSVEFERLNDSEVSTIFAALGLAITKSTKLEEVIACFGEPRKTTEYTKDRKTYDFIVGKNSEFEMSCTFLNQGQLVFFNMHTCAISA